MLILHEVNTMDKRLYKMMGAALAASLWLAPVSVQAAHIDFDRHSHESASQTAVHHERQTTAKAQQTAKAVQAEPSWYWLGSDDKYSKYFDPASVVITASVATDRGKVPTEIKVWTKTTYSYGGAQETLEAYGLNSKFPDPNQLAYSTAQLVIKPQYRTIQYAAEHFYNKNGEIIWSKADPKAVEKEINSQQFDEDFYAAAVDQAFHQNVEKERVTAKNRWLTVFDVTTTDGVRTHIKADTSTMRMHGENLVFWQWQETKDHSGQVREIKFLKMAVNLPQATEKAIAGKYWTPAEGWKSLEAAIDGQYRMVTPNSPEYKYIVELRHYVENNYAWVHRYSLE